MLEPVDVREVWVRVKDWLDVVAEDQDWRAEDVYAACVNGIAHIYMPDDDDDGLVVMRLAENQFTGEKSLFVWAAYSLHGDAQKIYSSQIEAIAREAGCLYIEFESKRKGFERDISWERQNTTYRRRL